MSCWRFIRSSDQAEFLDTLLATSTDKKEVVPADSPVWRAQAGNDWRPERLAVGVHEEVPSPYCPKRMKPPADRAFEGRANPRGIPCLYVATRKDTAVAEKRPEVGALVSVAQLKTTHELSIINCTTDDNRIMLYLVEPDAPERELAVWRDVDRAFSQPVAGGGDVADYAPTQIMAEFFRAHGFHGVAYRSSLGTGHNIALFELDAAEVVSCFLVKIRSVKLEYSETDSYFLEEH